MPIREQRSCPDHCWLEVLLIVSAHAEISTLQFLNYDYSKFPNIARWLAELSKLPEIQTAYAVHYQLVKQTNPELNDYNKQVIGWNNFAQSWKNEKLFIDQFG
jgi:hypothetical protein